MFKPRNLKTLPQNNVKEGERKGAEEETLLALLDPALPPSSTGPRVSLASTVHRITSNGLVQNVVRQCKPMTMATIDDELLALVTPPAVEPEYDIFADLGEASNDRNRLPLEFQLQPVDDVLRATLPESIKRLTESGQGKRMGAERGDSELDGPKKRRLVLDEEGNVVDLQDKDDYELSGEEEYYNEEESAMSKRQMAAKQSQKLNRQIKAVEEQLRLKKDLN